MSKPCTWQIIALGARFFKRPRPDAAAWLSGQAEGWLLLSDLPWLITTGVVGKVWQTHKNNTSFAHILQYLHDI